MPSTVRDLVDRALVGFDALTVTAEPIEDEYQYVRDLETVWTARLRAVAVARADEPASPEAEVAVATVVDEASRITDPHRAIDWLSTLPQVVLTALVEAP